MKISSSCVPILLAAATLVYAADDCNYCVEDAPCMESCTASEFYVSGSFLYWNAGMNNLYYVLESRSDVSDLIPPKDVISTGDIREPGYGWAPGVEASIGWRQCECGWDFELVGTYYKTDAKDSIRGQRPDFSAPNLVFLTPLINPSFGGNFTENASAKWELTFGKIDALGSGWFSPWECVSLRPNIGLRTAWIHQELDIEYGPLAFFLSDFSILVDNDSFTKQTNEYWGIGFKGGIDFEATLCFDLSLIGGFGASILFGDMKSKSFIEGHTVDPGAPTFLNNIQNTISEKFNKVAADIETDLGLAYSFGCGCFSFDLSARYLFSLWIDQSEFHNFVFSVASVTSPELFLNFQEVDKLYSNLVMHGLILSLEVGF